MCEGRDTPSSPVTIATLFVLWTGLRTIVEVMWTGIADT